MITDESENYIKSACNIAVPHGSISGDRATLSSRSITEAAEFSSACLWARAAAAAKAFCTTSVDIAPTGPGWQSTPVLNSNAPCNGKSSPNRHSKHLAPTSISITCFTHHVRSRQGITARPSIAPCENCTFIPCWWMNLTNNKNVDKCVQIYVYRGYKCMYL